MPVNSPHHEILLLHERNKSIKLALNGSSRRIEARKRVNQAREEKFPLDFRYNAILVKLLFKHTYN